MYQPDPIAIRHCYSSRVNDRSDDKRTAFDFVDQEKDAAISRLLIARGGVYGLAH